MNEFSVHKGRTKKIRVPVVYKDGTACKLVDGDVIRFATKTAENSVILFEKTLEYDKSNDKAILTFDPEDTADLPCGDYYYDIGVDFADGGYKDIIEWAKFHVLPSAAGKE